MKFKRLPIIALFIASSISAFAQGGELSIGTEGAYPPWSMADASGNVTGFDADVGNLLCTALQDFLDKPEGKDFRYVDVSITSTYDSTLGAGIGVGIPQENTELKAEIDAALCKLVADGSIGKASKKWFKTDISRPCQ